MEINDLIFNAIKLTAGIIYILTMIVVAWNWLAPTQYTWLNGSILGSLTGSLLFFTVLLYGLYLWKALDL